MTFPRIRVRPRAAMLLVFALGALASAPVHAWRFGTGCQESYQNGWQTTLSYVYERCAGFNNELDDTDTKVFYYSLVNGNWWWEDAGDQSYVDNVNLFYGSTHGGGWSTRSVWAMWNDGLLASSTMMRLGDESGGVEILSTYACETLKFNDGRMWTRMGSIFRGGLLIATGSHDKVYDGFTTDETGEDYADNLQDGKTIKYAWKDANSDWATSQDLTVMATGQSSADCHGRKDGMKWSTLNNYARLKDGAIKYYCYSYWNNL